MADLDFKHHVAQIPRGEALPETFKRTEKAQTSNLQDVQGPTNRYAESTNWMSSVGARVAQGASNQIAKQFGYEMGKNPQGDVFPTFTDFDKTFVQSYNTQAQATLGTQADKLLTDAELQLGKATRLTPELISKTNQQVQKGLSTIAQHAPVDIKSHLESNFASMMNQQNLKYQLRMFGEQREDEKNNLVAALNVNNKQINQLAMSGDYKAAEQLSEQTQSMAQAGARSRHLTPDIANTAADAARLTAVQGKYIHGAIQARNQGKLAEYERNFADSNQPDLSYADKLSVAKAMNQQMQVLESLRSQDQNLTSTKFHLSMIQDLGGITNTQIQDALSKLTPLQGTNLLIDYNKAIQKANKDGVSLLEAKRTYTNAESFSQQSSEVKTKVLADQSAQYIQDQAKVGNTVSPAEAKMHIAAIAGGPIPSYISSLNSKAESGNPVSLQEVSAAIDYVGHENSNPQNLKGLSDKSKAMVAMFNAFSDSHDPVTAAQMAKEVVYNKDEKVQKAAEKNWTDYVKKNKSSGQSDYSFALSIAGVDKDSLVDVPYLSDFVNDKFKGYYILSHGNEDIATRLTKADIDSTFGYTNVNGQKQFTHLPLNRMYGLPDDANGLIHEDMRGQVEKQFESSKALYDKGASDFYWMTQPQASTEHIQQMMIDVRKPFVPSNKGLVENSKERLKYDQEIQFKKNAIENFRNGAPPKVIQHFRDGSSHEYELNVQSGANLGRNKQGGMVGYYDVNLKQGNTITSIAMADPNAGFIKYIPNKNKILEQYQKLFPHIVHPTVDIMSMTSLV